MADADKVASLLHEVSETHHQVFRITDGTDSDWASWYADWLVTLSELPNILGKAPVRSELVYLLVQLDKEYRAYRSTQQITDHSHDAGPSPQTPAPGRGHSRGR